MSEDRKIAWLLTYLSALLVTIVEAFVRGTLMHVLPVEGVIALYGFIGLGPIILIGGAIHFWRQPK